MTPSAQTRDIVAHTRDGQAVPCVVTFTSAPPWTVRLDGLRPAPAPAEGPDLFACLESLRAGLEPAGVRLLCEGACRDVMPSPMMRGAGGRFAYRLRLGRPTRPEDRVDIFAPAERERVASAAEQRAFARAWLDSLGAPVGART